MSHEHHHHTAASFKMNTAFIVGISLNFVFVLIEVISGLINHSLSLLSDAGHNLADVGSLALSLFAFKLLKVKSNDQFTYGYRKTSILVALFNSMILLISIGIIAYEAMQRLFNPQPVEGLSIALVAGIGIVINFTTAIMFFKGKEDDLNIKSAYLHLMSDALVSLVIVIGGVTIYYLKWFWVDPLLGILVAVVILWSTYRLLKDSLRLSLDGVPANINIADIKETTLKVKGVVNLYHIHIWAMSTTENALTAQLVLSPDITINEEQKIKSEIKHALERKNIHHVTLETQRENDTYETNNCDNFTIN
ncbi:MAG: cation diffusion facilitator family transporter [Ginsengibacter sp.]